MVNKALKDSFRRKLFLKKMCIARFCKYILCNKTIPPSIRSFYKPLSQSLSIKIRNRCIVTGRSRGVYRFCKLSRGVLQEKALAGELNGISKTSW